MEGIKKGRPYWLHEGKLYWGYVSHAPKLDISQSIVLDHSKGAIELFLYPGLNCGQEIGINDTKRGIVGDFIATSVKHIITKTSITTGVCYAPKVVEAKPAAAPVVVAVVAKPAPDLTDWKIKRWEFNKAIKPTGKPADFTFYDLKLERNTTDILLLVNALRKNHEIPMIPIDSYWDLDYRPPKDHTGEDFHRSCDAIDFVDSNQQLSNWILENLPILKDRGLYMMHPTYTPGWVHLQSVKPYWSTDLVFDRSKKRIHYIPDDKPVTREFTLEREAPTDDGTFGTINVGINHTFKTLERPSCIPSGAYTVTLREPSAEFNYKHYHVQEAKDANGSELVLLHAGTSSDTGGIAIGKENDLTFGHFLPLVGSTEAFDEFKKMVGEERFRLVVKGGELEPKITRAEFDAACWYGKDEAKVPISSDPVLEANTVELLRRVNIARSKCPHVMLPTYSYRSKQYEDEHGRSGGSAHCVCMAIDFDDDPNQTLCKWIMANQWILDEADLWMEDMAYTRINGYWCHLQSRPTKYGRIFIPY